MPLRVLLALGVLVAALALPACGDDDDGGDAKAPSSGSAQTPDGDNANASDGGAGANDKGAGSDAAAGGSGNASGGNASSGDTEPVNLKQAKLTPAELQRLREMAPTAPPYKRFGFDRGSVKDRNAVMSAFRQMQQELFSGKFIAFCKRFGTEIDSLPNLESGDGQQRIKECAGIVSRVAKRVASGDLDWPPHKVEWLRVYRDSGRAPYAGVTVSAPGSEIRVSYSEKDGRWRPDFAVPRDLSAFTAR